MTGEHLLDVKGLDTYYGAVQILHDVAFHVDAGEIVTLIGPNGAGKSTALKAVVGLVKITKGEVRYQGNPITGTPPEGLIANGLTFVSQGQVVFPSLTVRENLELGAYTLTDAAAIRDRMEALLNRFPVLRERATQRAGLLSGGEQQQLALARALMVKPRLLLLDEPSLGLAPKIVAQVLDQIREINRQEKTAILMVEQNAHQALEVSHRAYVLDMGRVALTDRADTLLADDRVKRIYLGQGGANPEPASEGSA
ncbi:MAG TPA: ABC transporter ATP-binding protein [Candidatus Thermoplasmatota archaeon]|nr:ABC transporter ATP-binding protein [Candidatus Thermoplasmatota archaeon]